MKALKLIPVVFICIFTQFLFAEEPGDTMSSMEKLEWRKVRDRDGIQVYMKHRDESKIKSFKAITIMKVPDPYSMAAVFDDYESAPKWIHFISELSDLGRNSETDRYIRIETRLPWPVADRDSAVHALVNQDKETGDITIEMMQDNEILPTYPGYIRMPEIQGAIRTKMLSGQRMYLELEFLMDPGGYIPSWISNIILKDVAYFSLKKLGRMLLRDEYQNQKDNFSDWLSVPDSYYDGTFVHPVEKS